MIEPMETYSEGVAMQEPRAIHEPVLLDEALLHLAPPKGPSLMVDANCGEGGHAEAFLAGFPDMTLLGVEVDREIGSVAERRLRRFGGRFRLFPMWYADFFRTYDEREYARPDRILFDLGVSAYHFEKAGRGFSFLRDEPLDMRLSEDQELTAEDIVNDYSERDLASVLGRFGEERYSGRIAAAVCRERRKRRIRRSLELAELIRRAVPPAYRRGRIHPATRSFQALRIEVNRELEQLRQGLEEAFRVLKHGGRLGVISFHSLEDRIVKHFFRERSRTCTCPPEWPVCRCGGRRELETPFKKPLTPGDEEKRRNPASRSAKLRVAEKLEEGSS